MLPDDVLAAFRVAEAVPVRLTGGQGTTWQAGQVVLKPADSVQAGRWFPAPGWRVTVESPWTIGDQVAWDERDPGPLLGPSAGQLAGQVRRLLAVLRPLDLPSQLIHADLAGNVLFADGVPPAVIDFSPLERPAGLPLAVVAVDALMWKGARPEVLDQLAGEPELDQLLARALVYRLVTESILRAATTGIETVARAAQPVTDLILARLPH